MTHKTCLFSSCEVFFFLIVVFTEKTFSFKNLKNAKEKRARGLAWPPASGAAALTRGAFFPLDERRSLTRGAFRL